MATNTYECLFLLDSNRFARESNTVPGEISELIEKAGGEVLASRLWNEQKLAYPVNGHRKGTYWLSYFRMPTANVSEFNHQCKLKDKILRHLVLKVDPRLVDTLVAHAKGETTEEPAEEAAAEGASTES